MGTAEPPASRVGWRLSRRRPPANRVKVRRRERLHGWPLSLVSLAQDEHARMHMSGVDAAGPLMMLSKQVGDSWMRSQVCI